MNLIKTATFAIAAALATTPALAGPVPGHGLPITTIDPTLNPFSVDGHIQIVYTFSDAANEDLILTLPTLNGNPIIDNKLTPKGTLIDLGNYTGNLTFKLQDLQTSATYYSDQLDAYGDYHVVLDTNYADFGVGSLKGSALANVTNLANLGYSIIFMAWEDHDSHTCYWNTAHTKCTASHSDWDYNDVIYAIAYKVNEHNVPEPLTLSLFGAGLAGAAATRRKRKAIA